MGFLCKIKYNVLYMLFRFHDIFNIFTFHRTLSSPTKYLSTKETKNKKRDRRTSPFTTSCVTYLALPAVPVVARKGINA